MIFSRSDLWILPEYQRKSPGILRINARCEKCSRHCIISSNVQSGFPSAYVDQLGDVFSLLCVLQGAEDPLDPDSGQHNPSSDASE